MDTLIYGYNYITNTCTIVTYHSYPLVNIQKNYGKSPSLMLIIMIFPIRITIFGGFGAEHPPCSDCHRLHHQQSVSRHGTAGIFDGLIRLENNT